MSYNNEKLPWILILAGSAILTLRLIIALFSSLSIVDWFAIIIIISGLILLIMNNNKYVRDICYPIGFHQLNCSNNGLQIQNDHQVLKYD